MRQLEGLVGLGLGPSTIAAVSATYGIWEPFYKEPSKEIRRLQRAMDRSRRATNPAALNPDSTSRRRSKIKNRSPRIVVAQGNLIKTEGIRLRSFQKALGKSVKRRAPFVSNPAMQVPRRDRVVDQDDATRHRQLCEESRSRSASRSSPMVCACITTCTRRGWHALSRRTGSAHPSGAVHWAAAEPLLQRRRRAYRNPRAGCALPIPTSTAASSGSPVEEGRGLGTRPQTASQSRGVVS
jgi:putative transposase